MKLKKYAYLTKIDFLNVIYIKIERSGVSRARNIQKNILVEHI